MGNEGITSRKITIRCRHCGGSNVLRDAYAAWNDASQAWELSATYDNAICEDCEGEARLVDRYLDTREPVGEDDLYDHERWRVRHDTLGMTCALLPSRESAEGWISKQTDPWRYVIEAPDRRADA